MKIRLTILLSAVMIPGILAGQSAYDLLLKAKALTASGAPEKAVELLSPTPAGLNDFRIVCELAEAKLIMGDLSGAIEDFHSSNRIRQYSGEYGLAKAYAIRGDASTSLYHLELSLKSPLRKIEKEIMLDPAFGRIENTPEWRLFWKKEWYPSHEKTLSEIEYYTGSGKTEDALAAFTVLKRDYAGHPSVTYTEALIKIASGKPGEALKSLGELTSAEPANEKYLRTLAEAQLASSNYAGASVTYSRLISMEVADAGLFLLRAGCYLKTGERDRALTDVKKYLDLYPDSKTAISMAGKTEAASGNNLKALEYFSENIKLHPNDPGCYVERGNSYFLSKSWQWAAMDYSMSLDLDPGNPEAWLNKGISLLNSGKTEDACHDFRRSFALGNRKAVEYISKHCIK